MIIGTSHPARMARQVSRTPIPGMFISRRIRSTVFSRSNSRASSPFWTSSTFPHCALRLVRRTLRIWGSSSMSNMIRFSVMNVPRRFEGKPKTKCRTLLFNIEPDLPLVSFRDRPRNHKAHPRALDNAAIPAAPVELVENSLALLLGYFTSLVTNGKNNVPGRETTGYPNRRTRPRILPRIVHDLKKHLLQEKAITRNRRKILRYLDNKLPAAQLARHSCGHAIHNA